MHAITFDDGSQIEIFAKCTRITLHDGAVIMGAPEDSDSYRATAENNGYGDDTLRLCKDHELMHLALANWLHSPSPTMEFVGHGADRDSILRGLEEDAVLSLQRFARALGIDLIALFSDVRGT